MWAAAPAANPILLKLDELRQLDDFHYSAAAERALGAALRATQGASLQPRPQWSAPMDTTE